MRELAAICLYLAALLAGLLLFDANAENNWIALGIWAVASVILGWSLARWPAALLPSLAIPMALPFGYADHYLGSDAPYVWWFAVFAGVIAVVVILVATAARKLYDRNRSRTSTA